MCEECDSPFDCRFLLDCLVRRVGMVLLLMLKENVLCMASSRLLQVKRNVIVVWCLSWLLDENKKMYFVNVCRFRDQYLTTYSFWFKIDGKHVRVLSFRQ